MSDRILATYLIETPFTVEEAAEQIAGEGSTGTFVPVPGETAELKARFRTRLEAVRPLETLEHPSVPYPPDPTRTGFQRAEIDVSIPLEMTGTDLTTVLASVYGNISEVRPVSGVKLLDVQFPPAFQAAHAGPQFGIAGTRRLANVNDRPLVGTIIKPSVGLTPEQTAAMVREMAAAEIDFIKDDELMTSPAYSTVAQRVAAVMPVINEFAEKTGKKVMYAFNISDDDIDEMLRRHDAVLAAGGTCVMVSVNHVGMAGVKRLRAHSQLPIHAHRNGWGMISRHPALGMDFRAYQKFWRLAGVDHLHVNGIRNKFVEPDASVVRSIQACLAPLFTEADRLMPVISSGQWGGQAPDTYRLVPSVDVMYLAGGGIQAHPGGPGAGVRAVRQAWEAATAGIDLETYAQDHPELAQTLATFGKKGK